MGRVVFKSNVLTIDSETEYMERKVLSGIKYFRSGVSEISKTEYIRSSRRKYRLVEK